MAAIVKNVKYTGSGTASPSIDTERKLICGFLPGSGWYGTTITFKFDFWSCKHPIDGC